MKYGLLIAFAAIVLLASSLRAATKVTIDENGVLNVDGKKIFLLSTSLPPLPGENSPEGKDGLTQLREDGLNFCRIRPPNPRNRTTVPDSNGYDEAGIRTIGTWLDAAHHAGLYCWVTLGKIPTLPDDKPKVKAENERLARLAIELYKDHPALAVWKGYDEPAWVRKSCMLSRVEL